MIARRLTALLLPTALMACASAAPLQPDAAHPASAEAPEGALYQAPAILPSPAPDSGASLQPAGPAWDGNSEKVVEDYTCTMHPQIHQPQPGNCPICGMTLVLHRHES